MKFWEVIKELTDDPTKKFEAKLSSRWTLRMSVNTAISRYFRFEIFYDNELIDQSSDRGAFNGNVALDLDWQLVRQPVTWQEAIQAWKSGKNIYAMSGAGFKFEHPAHPKNGPDQLTIGWGELQWGTWYVED